MGDRLKYMKVDPTAIGGLQEMENYIEQSNLDKSLVHLIKIRASQINGCAYCIDMHTKESRHIGETEERIHGLIAWRETPFYTERERSALAWTETLTLISENSVSDELYDELLEEFGEKELLSLTTLVMAINSWNRLAIAFKVEPGSYKITK